jgi:hypothetical protein
MDAHNGSLTAEPVSTGHGIAFVITLPVSVANGEEEPIDNSKELSTST